MNDLQRERFKRKVERLAEDLGIGSEAAALIIELHDVAQAFHRVADAMGKPRAYEMREEGAYGEERTVFRPVDDWPGCSADPE